MPRFPEPEWFLALGRLMAAQGELFRRIGYVDTRFIVRVLPEEGPGAGELNVGVVMQGYALAEVAAECHLRQRAEAVANRNETQRRPCDQRVPGFAEGSALELVSENLLQPVPDYGVVVG